VARISIEAKPVGGTFGQLGHLYLVYREDWESNGEGKTLGVHPESFPNFGVATVNGGQTDCSFQDTDFLLGLIPTLGLVPVLTENEKRCGADVMSAPIFL